MAWNDNIKSGGKYLSTKIGTDVTVKINKITKITDKPKFDPKDRNSVGQGFHFEFDTDKGIITVGTYTLQGALSRALANEGMTVRIQHPAKGEYKVELLSPLGAEPQETLVKEEEPPIDDSTPF